ncbi:hypothetical protein BN85402300 [Alteracholeplasma palmae J233]|uniref:Uncharacterized protein n=1 Tax=Alteracholeplasma palmae (strain ATCC 49389 / J233) TaxID=1318466 RepID=U4KJZ2_ALTPJ|nr:hypothetical protein [Alteracholeplasma palmae]CCV63807.1 hypothetical protein BN85402300 [Alteracholeplasma palmae J233]
MKKLRNKQNLYFVLTILTFILIIVGSILSFSFDLSFDSSLMIMSAVLFIGLILIIYFKSKLDFYNDNYKYQKLISHRILPFKTKTNVFSDDWYKKIKSEGFNSFRSYEKFEVYYKFDFVSYKSKKQKAAVFLILIKDNDLSFDSQKIVTTIHEFEDAFRKKEKFLHHIVLQYKVTEDSLSSSDLNETLGINFMTQGKRNHLVVINCYYSRKDSEFIFLYSPNFSPNHYYTYASNIILSLIKYK